MEVSGNEGQRKPRRDVPRQQDPLVLFQLSHEAGVRLGHCAPFLHVVIGSVQVPAVLLHCVGNHSGGRAAHPHFAVHKALRSMLPSWEMEVKAGQCESGVPIPGLPSSHPLSFRYVYKAFTLVYPSDSLYDQT